MINKSTINDNKTVELFLSKYNFVLNNNIHRQKINMDFNKLPSKKE